jgi:hypothetical protein
VIRTPVAELVREQVEANESGAAHRTAFQSHREHLTALLTARAGDGALRLCLLGAGNCNDVDLSALLERYREVHLVDLDASALERALGSVTGNAGSRLFLHAPVDVSGVLDKIERWGRMQLTPAELMGHAEETTRSLVSRLGAPFDVVASTCLLTQIQRAPVAVLGDSHRLFQAVRHTLSVTHLRVLHGLAAKGGRSLLVTDLSADSIKKLPDEASRDELLALIPELIRGGNVFQIAQPALLGAMAKDDPVISADAALSKPIDAWYWQNGPDNRFLVYATELERRA